jgi:hypothetical protein
MKMHIVVCWSTVQYNVGGYEGSDYEYQIYLL